MTDAEDLPAGEPDNTTGCGLCGRSLDGDDPDSRAYLVVEHTGMWCRACLRETDPEYLALCDRLDRILRLLGSPPAGERGSQE